jgi:hypothetical protein
MDIPLHDAAAPGQRQGHAPDVDTRPRRPPHLAEIAGWGSDLDRDQRPAEPKERRPPRLEGVHWHEIEPQVAHVTVLHSSERPGLTPLFGSPQPPRGISGRIRRWAFGYSENDLRHWLLLLFADRVDVGEGLVDDVSRGHVPRLYAEMGGRAELRHQPKAAVVKAAVLVAAIGIVVAWRRARVRR